MFKNTKNTSCFSSTNSLAVKFTLTIYKKIIFTLTKKIEEGFPHLILIK